MSHLKPSPQIISIEWRCFLRDAQDQCVAAISVLPKILNKTPIQSRPPDQTHPYTHAPSSLQFSPVTNATTT